MYKLLIVPPEVGKGASGASPVAASAMPAATTTAAPTATAAPATTATPSACQWCFRLLFSMFLICSVHPCAVHRGTQNDGGEKKEIELQLHHELTNFPPEVGKGASGASPVAASAMPAATTTAAPTATAAPATTATPSACQWCFRLLFSMFLICSVHPCAVHRGTQNDGGEKKEIELQLHHELTNCISKASR
ncbi:hypothetical protein SprV_0602069400 [Sparganum proliferum]